MSNDVAIKVEKLSKRYRIGAREKQASTLRERIENLVASPFDYLRSTLRGPSEEEILWALKDVSFEVKHGEVLGIIGRNGAGKSTLLKILCRITEPTRGMAEIDGRVGSLLEVGTGFHPELTGRENIYMNGAILGMSRKEINRKFQEIVAFAEIEKFIDTPVKRYSSGMYVRLAFAVAGHLDPEILLVDEVLAVGDAAFQKKCLGKMGEVAKGGRTVLFVSHNMGAITNLCERAICLENGQLKLVGHVNHVVRDYLTAGTAMRGQWILPAHIADEKAETDVRLTAVRVVSQGEPTAVVDVRYPFQIEIEYQVKSPVKECVVWLRLVNDAGIDVLTTLDTDSTEWGDRVRPPGFYRSICEFPSFLLRPQRYIATVGVGIVKVKLFDRREDILQFEVAEAGSLSSLYGDKRAGVVMPLLPWRVLGPS